MAVGHAIAVPARFSSQSHSGIEQLNDTLSDGLAVGAQRAVVGTAPRVACSQARSIGRKDHGVRGLGGGWGEHLEGVSIEYVGEFDVGDRSR